MRFDSVDSLRAEGFEGFKSVKELTQSCSDVSKEKGVYLVMYLGGNRPGFLPDFLPKGVGGFYKGDDPNGSLVELASSWVNGTIVLYIGQTGHSLRKRISQYVKFGEGKSVSHHGGRYIWQLKEHEDLVLCWRTCRSDSENPKRIENELLSQFRTIYGKLPFANLPKEKRRDL